MQSTGGCRLHPKKGRGKLESFFADGEREIFGDSAVKKEKCFLSETL